MPSAAQNNRATDRPFSRKVYERAPSMETPEPINIFAHRIDPRGVLAVCRDVASEVQVVGPEEDWRELTLLGPRRLGRRRMRLRISHDSLSYEQENWPGYVRGMVSYFAEFAPAPRHQDILHVVASFRFVLGFPDVDLAIASPDPRVAWVHAICRHLDGVLFTPTMLLDSAGRLLISCDGRFDPAAILPRVPASSETEPSDDCNLYEADDDQQPPTADRVARRAVVLTALGNRGLIENEGTSQESPQENCQAMLDWIRYCGAAEELESLEAKVLQRPYGTLDSQAKINAVWRLEGVGVLLWALGLYQLPPYDQLVDPGDLFARVEIFDADATRVMIANARLRCSEELMAYQKHATMTHWRLRSFSLRPTHCDFVAASRGCWIGTFDIARFRIAKGDMMIGEREISKADPGLVEICASIAHERHLAINWLLGDSLVYSETDTST